MIKNTIDIDSFQYYRTAAGVSQRQLAIAADVPVRTIQQYEQRQKVINRAQAETLGRLAQTLCCKVEDLLEMTESPGNARSSAMPELFFEKN